jgi:hypothetical protein
MRGGKRPDAGRKPGSMSGVKTRLQQTARDVAAQVLSEVDAVAVWKKLILQQEKPRDVSRGIFLRIITKKMTQNSRAMIAAMAVE